MFSPYYAAARRRGPADPHDHCAVNVALYGPRGKRWAMTERRRTSVFRNHDTLMIGDSQMTWDGQSLVIDIAELAIPKLTQIAGRIRLYPDPIVTCDFHIDTIGRHWWRPIAPRARVDVQMKRPAVRWCGTGYFDSNSGTEPLENAFSTWTWSRTDVGDGAAVLYDVVRRDAEPLSLAVHFDGQGTCEAFTSPPPIALPPTAWRIERRTRSEAGAATVRRTLEDTPFYARSEIEANLFGSRRRCMHESLSLDRFRRPWVQAMLPFRMPRAFR